MSKTFIFEESLPALTVPPLQNTIEKYLDSVIAVASSDEYEKTAKICHNFATTDGPVFQQKLKEREKDHKNWVEDYWLNKAYLELRVPLTHMNFSGICSFSEQFWPIKPSTQIERCAFSLHLLAKFWKKLRNEEIVPHSNRKGTPFSMQQFRNTFNSTRIPARGKDEIATYFRTAQEGACPSHSVVMYRGYFFKLQLITATGEPHAPPPIEAALREIVGRCSSRERDGPGVAALTALDRDAWATERARLIALSEANRASLEAVESAVHVVALDPATPADFAGMMSNAAGGDARLRWRDKSYTEVWTANGAFAANCDHTAVDGMVFVAYLEYVTAELRACGGVWKRESSRRQRPDECEVSELRFDVDESLTSAIERGQSMTRQFSDDLIITCPVFDGIGWEELNAVKVNPDGFVQIALQLAYMRMHGEPAPTYETATTRSFYHGRTETCRTCTPQVVAFCRAAMTSSRDDERGGGDVIELLGAAHDKYVWLMGECRRNRGCDRHLFGLEITAANEGMKIPELFTDPMYEKSGGRGNFVLSTSFVGHFNSTGLVAPMVAEGFGCFYRVNRHRIAYAVSSWRRHRSAVDFNRQIELAFRDVYELFRRRHDNSSPASSRI